jgi:DUF1680 family protein
VLLLKLNGNPVRYAWQNGFAVIEHEWKKGDIVSVEFPMEVKQIMASTDLKYDNERIAIQRGPLVYCIEGADNKEGVWNLTLPLNSVFSSVEYKVLDEPVMALQAELPSAYPEANGTGIGIRKRKVTAIPYYCWANRGANPMQVWLPTKIREVKINYVSKYGDGGNY